MNNLFVLLRLGLGLEQDIAQDNSSFSEMKEQDWLALKDMTEKQGVSAIALDGLNELVAQSDDIIHAGVDKDWWKSFLLQWMGTLLYVEQANLHQITVMNQMANIWMKENLKVMVMKGQVNGLFYPKPLHRSPGDIDCYLFEDYAIGNNIARMNGADVDESWYKHSVIRYNDETFENHQFFVHTREGKRSKRLQKELKDALNSDDWEMFPNSNVCLPPVQWNAMFLTYHACAHFITEGLRLKQVLDWAMFLQKEQDNVDWSGFYAFCDRHHLRRFADAITAISVKYLGVKISNPKIATKNPYAEKIVLSALYDNDYIYGVGESLWGGRWHLVKSLFKHRWKYEEIYQQSVWKQLWWYITGFLFHTEKT